MNRILLFIFTLFSITFLDAQQLINGHEYVDLGLPSGTVWAKFNVDVNEKDYQGLLPCVPYTIESGSTVTPRGFSYYFWGATKTMPYTKKKCKVGKNIIDISGNPKFDACTANWGAPWRLPNAVQFQELISECQWERIQVARDGWSSRYGWKATGPNGNYIVFPETAYYSGYISRFQDSWDNWRQGWYWTSTKCGHGIYVFRFGEEGGPYLYEFGDPLDGHCIRPVINNRDLISYN